MTNLVSRYNAVSAYINNQTEEQWAILKKEIARIDGAGTRAVPHANCTAKHTTFQPLDTEWACPSCKSGIDQFYIDESAGHEDCAALHKEDYVVCHKCGAAYDGEKLSKLLAKINNLKPCPHCKGTGVIPT
jgi:rubredoxin